MRKLTIIGGGLAGLTLGIALRQRGVPVTLFEAGGYPRHRVCGEFISGRGVDLLRRFGLADRIHDKVKVAHTVAFFSGDRQLAVKHLPQPALCISRHVLDAALADEFSALGGDLRCNTRVTGPAAEGTVLAMGRRRAAPGGRWHWFGMKVHARNVLLCADLEMHLARDAYVGLCRLSNGWVNVCGLFRRRSGNVPVERERLLLGAPGSPLFHRLSDCEFAAESHCSVGGLTFERAALEPGTCRIGDALAMTPPITGNGMSMAFESAALAAGPLERYARGASDWNAAVEAIQLDLRRAFVGRLVFACFLHRALFMPHGRSLLPLLFRSGWMWRAAFLATRRGDGTGTVKEPDFAPAQW